MGRTYQAMLRAERERLDRDPLGAPDAPEPEGLAWEAEEPALGVGAGGVDWGAFVFDQVGSIDQRLDAFDEALRKRVPELEGRLLHLLELRLGSLERSIVARLGGLSRNLVGAHAGGTRWLRGLLALNLVLVTVALLKLA